MNILDTLAFVIVGILLFIGFVKGFLSKILEIVIFLLSLAAAYICYRNGGSLLWIILSLVITNIALHLISWGIMKMALKNKMKATLASRFAGGAIGGIEGAVLVLLMLVFLHLISGTTGAENFLIAKMLDTSYLYARYKTISMASPIPVMKKVYRIGETLKAKEGKITLDERAVSKLREHASIKAILADTQLIDSIIKKDYGAIVLNPKFLSILNDIKLLKQILAILFQEKVSAITKEEEVKEIIPTPEKAENFLAGIVYLKGSREALINSTMYRTGSQIFGGQITEITENTMTVEFPDKRKQYSIGDTIP